MSIIVYGAGAWGTALALTSLKTPQSTTLMVRRPEHAKDLCVKRENVTYLPGVVLPAELGITADLSILSQEASLLLLVTPAQSTQETIQALAPFLHPNTPVVICAKGIDLKSLRLLSCIVQEHVTNPVAVLSGPSFAQEVAHNLPTAVTISAEDMSLAKFIAHKLRHPYFRCYASTDMIGSQVGGALKNVLAIACGIVHGRQLGYNAAAALLCRGLAEMQRFGVALGAHKDTFLGLSGVGDLTLTSSSLLSRNYSLGCLIGRGQTLQDILATRQSVTEGVATAAAVIQLSARLNVRMPICHAVYELLHQDKPLNVIIEELLQNQADEEF